MLDRMYKIYRIAQTIKVERVVLNALASAVERVPLLIQWPLRKTRTAPLLIFLAPFDCRSLSRCAFMNA